MSMALSTLRVSCIRYHLAEGRDVTELLRVGGKTYRHIDNLMKSAAAWIGGSARHEDQLQLSKYVEQYGERLFIGEPRLNQQFPFSGDYIGVYVEVERDG